MKIHRHLVEQVIAAVHEIFSSRRPADKVLERYLKTQKKWGARDRRFFAESCYEIVRHWRYLWVASGLPPGEFLDADALTPKSVWRLWAFYENERTGQTPQWAETEGLRFQKTPRESLPRAVRESIPDWLDELGAKEFGAEWDSLLSALNKPADVFLRVNRLKGDPGKAVRELAADEVDAESVPGLPDALRLPVRKNVFITKAFRAGLFEVQDAASQTVAPMLKPEPGLRVVDACAGAGGKTLHLAALMKNKGRILSLDIHEWKLDQLRERARRGGVDIVETRVIESSKTIKRLEASFDRVLLDVPCSGLGVLRRNPDTKWKLAPAEIDRLRALQSELLASYSKMLKPGGFLVYATCSLLPDENERQVKAFLASPAGARWTLEEEQHHRPDREGFDGFYAARLRLS
ncbi:MAG: RsmB/NOP family class I SAM-dependent RNA methyltransferase [Bdellovibrionaceae bacterium]|nr:RsmB/NOP family class I SAM-dependent RNA methyltransferase [Pseudobdellovibrionaceae bacterium]MBX3033119.1 RsmB/NOP family class I SAM-dependent RNA methyltransferase [Pseudobdellovibrionaceae bacterium]